MKIPLVGSCTEFLRRRAVVAVLATMISVPALMTSHADAATWNISGPTDIWSTGAGDTNWDAGVTWTNGNQAVFGGTNGEAITVATVTASKITFSNTGTAYNLSGGTITLNSGADPVVNATVDATISSNISISGGQTWAVSAGKTLTLGNINAAAANTAWGVSGAGSYLINGSIGSNVGNVLFNSGSGVSTTATFTTANTFTGQLWLGNGGNSSTLNFSDVNQLGTGANDTNFIAIQNGSTLNYTGTGSQSATAGRGLYWNQGTATISVANASANLTLGGTVGTARNQNFTKTGAGTLTLNSTATITGGTVTVNGGTLVLQASNTSTSGATVSAGTLVAGNASALGTGLVKVSGGTLNTTVANLNTGAFTLDNVSSSVGINGALVGSITLASTKDFSLSLGTVSLEIASLSSFDQFKGADSTGHFSLTGGTIALNGFAGFEGSGGVGNSYALFSGFAGSGNTVSALNIQGYDTNNWMASINATTGTLVFTAVPEPGAWMSLLGGMGVLVGLRRRRTAF